MNEFELIDFFFKSIPHDRSDVVFGIGDDAACLQIPAQTQLLVSSDTLVADVHFLSSWDAYDIACKAVMVNVSDIAAMGGSPCWLTLALTLPDYNQQWLQRFAQGLTDSLSRFNIALIGGDTTRGPLSVTLTIHGLVPANKAIRRSGAKVGDKIYVSGPLGAAAQAVVFLSRTDIDADDLHCLNQKLMHPNPRVDLAPVLQQFATAAIDISDGFSADLAHICDASQVGANLNLAKIPVHPLVENYQGNNAIEFALSGGDDYELCFTVSSADEKEFLHALELAGLTCYQIGIIEATPGLRARQLTGEVTPLDVKGYSHF